MAALTAVPPTFCSSPRVFSKERKAVAVEFRDVFLRCFCRKMLDITGTVDFLATRYWRVRLKVKKFFEY